MKKTLLLITLLTTLQYSFAENGAYASCAGGTDDLYSKKAALLESAHDEKIENLEKERDTLLKNSFTFFKLKKSLQMMQEIRTMYRLKENDTDAEFKKGLQILQNEHEREISECSLQKKNIQE